MVADTTSTAGSTRTFHGAARTVLPRTLTRVWFRPRAGAWGRVPPEHADHCITRQSRGEFVHENFSGSDLQFGGRANAFGEHPDPNPGYGVIPGVGFISSNYFSVLFFIPDEIIPKIRSFELGTAPEKISGAVPSSNDRSPYVRYCFIRDEEHFVA